MPEFNANLHIFKSSKFQDIIRDSIDFFNGTQAYYLPGPDRFNGTGVYALYYSGDFEYYEVISRRNKKESLLPIYVGKAVPKGWRQARLAEEQSTSLYTRLKEHKRSIEQADNLEIDDFRCRFMILDDEETDLIGTVEAALIRSYNPLWNSVIDGFGNHDPGSGRYQQAKSEWDILHPGRSWASKLTGKVVPIESIIDKIRNYK